MKDIQFRLRIVLNCVNELLGLSSKYSGKSGNLTNLAIAEVETGGELGNSLIITTYNTLITTLQLIQVIMD